MALTNNDEIKERVKTGFKEYESQAQKYRVAARRFRDPSSEFFDDYTETGNYEDNEYVEDQAAGSINHVRTNIQTKTDTVAFGDPDFHIESLVPDLVELQRTIIKAAWEHCNLTWWAKKAALNRFIGGLGLMAYLYDKDRGPVFEHVRKSDFAPDPSFTDINNLRFGSRRIRLPRDVARERYPAYEGLFRERAGKDGTDGVLRRQQVEFKVYWDADTEATLFGTTVVDKGKNHYGQVPVIFLQGDVSPDRDNDTGDYDNATGLQDGLSLGWDAMQAQALHGGPINIYRGSAISGKKERNALENGRANGWIRVEGDIETAIKRVGAEPPNPNLITWLEKLERATDEATFVSAIQRGSPEPDVQFATQSQNIVNNSGSRQNASLHAYERFCDRLVKKLVDLILKFEKPTNKEHMIVLQALAAVKLVRVVEGSTSYKDPAAEFQQNMMLGNVGLQFAAAGVSVNLEQLWLDICRAAQKRDVQKYISTQAPGAAPGNGAPGAPGSVGTPGTPQQGGPTIAPTLTHSPTISPSLTHNPSPALTITHNPTVHIHEAKPTAPKQPAGKNGGK